MPSELICQEMKNSQCLTNIFLVLRKNIMLPSLDLLIQVGTFKDVSGNPWAAITEGN